MMDLSRIKRSEKDENKQSFTVTPGIKQRKTNFAPSIIKVGIQTFSCPFGTQPFNPKLEYATS